jgi:hypothetical protein
MLLMPAMPGRTLFRPPEKAGQLVGGDAAGENFYLGGGKTHG